MTSKMPVAPPIFLVLDTSVLVNFLRIDRVDLIRDLSSQFLVTDHVVDEITDVSGDQLGRFKAAVAAGCFQVCSVKGDAALEMFGRLTSTQRLGTGESATIAYAISIGAGLALDDKRAMNEARRIDEGLLVFRSADLIVQMICEGLLTIKEADAIKDDWAAKHKFRLKITSFGDFL